MPHIVLDIRTLSLITVLFALMFGAGLVAFGVTHPVFSGLKKVGAGMGLIGLGFLLIGCRHHIATGLSVVAANSAIVAGFMLVNLGVQDFRQVPRSDTWLGVTVVLVNVLALLCATYVFFSFVARTFWACASLAVLSGMCCRNALRGSAGVRLVPQRILALGFGLFGAFMLVRALWALDESITQDLMTASPIHGLSFLAMILVLLSTTFGLAWMANEQLFQELRQYEQIVSTTPEGIALLDREGRYRLVNDAILRFVGLDREAMLGKRSLDLFGQGFYETVTVPNIRKAFAGEAGTTSTWLELPGAGKVYVTIKYHPVPDSRGGNAFAAIHITNMTELYHAQRDKQRLFDLSLDLFCVGGMDGHFKEVNPAWTRALGWSEAELLATPWRDFIHPEDIPLFTEAERLLAGGNPVIDLVIRIRARDGAYRYISWMTYPDEDGHLIYSVGRDVTDRIAMERELRELATRDPLTGADNRRKFMQRLNEEIERSSRYGTPLCLLMLDLDRFKDVNDTYGHAVGDDVLRRCVEICRETLRSTDSFGRIGGEEFAVALPHTTLEAGAEIAERLRENLSRCALDAGADSVQFTASVGVAGLHPGESAESFLKRGDDALYRAKDGGRNRIEKG